MNMVYYAFAIPQENGTLTLNTSYLDEVMKLKNNGIRVLLVIDGANAAPLKAMVKLCDNTTTRATFVSNILDLVKKYNFDGVDVDWEFPGILSSQAGYEKYTTAVDIKNLNSLLKELREGFNSLQDAGGSSYILSVATPPTDWGTDRFDYATINKYCDYVNMMSYDLNKSNVTSHLAHVYQPSNSYSYKFCCDFGVSYYTSLGLDKSKIILGAAAYGKAYKVSGSTPNSKLPGLGMSGTLGQVSGFGLAGQSITWNSGTIYYTGIQTLINSGKFTQYNEYNNSGKLVGSYLYNATDKYFITFDSVLSVIEKCKYAANNKGMGIMVWAYGEDATDTIVNTICDNL
jgi:chitinase